MRRLGQAFLTLAMVATTAGTPALAADKSAAVGPRYDHIFVIIEENHGFTDVIGNPAAPNLNALAKHFGLATNYFGITHPSEPNYVALLGGNTFGVASDDPYFINAVNKPSLISQLDQAGVSWKAYLQALPYAGYQGICYPSRCNGSPDVDPLYVSKHNAIQNFTTSLNAKDWARQVPIEQLSADLASGTVPAFNYIIPDECHDEHGDPPYCLDSGNPGDPQDQHLVALGDEYLGRLVSSITNASFWSKGNNAISIIYDEGGDNAGCCDATPGGGRVASIVVTNHGPRNLQDPTPYNHYSLLRTVQDSFGLGCLEFTCDSANIKPMTPLFAVTGSPVETTHAINAPDFPTPSPTPTEPVTFTTHSESSDGWAVVPGPLRGTNDNSFGAVAAISPTDVWAVGNFLPDTANSNQDATLTLAAHFDGTRWTVTPTPNAGPNFNTFFAAAAAGGKAWAVGVHQNAAYQTRGLIEAWDGSNWTIANNPQPGAERDLLYGASAVSPNDAWVVGEQQDAAGKFATLIEHWNGSTWSVVPSPNPGSSGNHLYGVAAIDSHNVWAVGQRNGETAPDQALIEHWDGTRWSVVMSPTHGTASGALYGVAADKEGHVWAVGETIDPLGGGRPLVEMSGEDQRWTAVDVPQSGSPWTTLWSVAVSDGVVWPAGTFLDMASGKNKVFILRGSEDRFGVVHAPNPGAGTNVLSSIASAGDSLYTVGHFKDRGARQTLVERHQER